MSYWRLQPVDSFVHLHQPKHKLFVHSIVADANERPFVVVQHFFYIYIIIYKQNKKIHDCELTSLMTFVYHYH